MILGNLLEEEFPHDWKDESKERDSLVPNKPYYQSKGKRENPPRKYGGIIQENERAYK